MDFGKLIDAFLQFLEYLNPFVVVNQYDGAVRIRAGRSKGELKAGKGFLGTGLFFKWPFIDAILNTQIVPTTMNLAEQSITTLDWKVIATRAVIKYEVEDVEKLLTQVNDATDAVSDVSKGIIREAISRRNFIDINGPELTKDVNVKIKREALKWGIKVIDVTFTDLAETPAFRLFNSTSLFQQT